MDPSRARGAELRGELLVSLDPVINRPALWHAAVFTDRKQWLALRRSFQQFFDNIIGESFSHPHPQPLDHPLSV